MLGIRKFNGTSLDLWVGDPNMFECDTIVIDSKDRSYFDASAIPVNSLDLLIPGHLAKLWSQLAIEESKVRHIAICFTEISIEKEGEKQFREFFFTLRQHLHNESKPECLNRISFIFSNLSHHNRFQEFLFSAFPEE